METMDAIFSRRSVRSYTDAPISDEALHTILLAGMAGPSCTNARDGSFRVVRDKNMRGRMADANGRPAAPLRTAQVGIMILGDLERAFQPAPDYWIIDGAIAGQNMVLAATSLGIGSVWLGTYPQMDRVQRQRELFALPQTVVPHSILAFGYPADQAPPRPDKYGAEKGAFEVSRVHYETW